MAGVTDQHWASFEPLWVELEAISPMVLLAGGYGLFLKQSWLSREEVSTRGRPLVPLRGWIDPAPRVTKDLDFLAGLDLIASKESQEAIDSILRRQGFRAVPENARWQFSRKIDHDREVVVEFHSPVPAGGRSDIEVKSRRVKPKPPLGIGIHGRSNPEAVGCELHPFVFEIAGTSIRVPNPITWTAMKLVAMSERWVDSQSPGIQEGKREWQAQQAIKHARDAFRVVAMMTRAEADLVPDILTRISDLGQIEECCRIHEEYFLRVAGPGRAWIRDQWSREDGELIRRMMGSWFPSAG